MKKQYLLITISALALLTAGGAETTTVSAATHHTKITRVSKKSTHKTKIHKRAKKVSKPKFKAHRIPELGGGSDGGGGGADWQDMYGG